MSRQHLPIGIQDFRTIRSENFYYVAKTALIRSLVDEGRHHFLSRPRRFGKSLLLDTMKSLFKGHEPLFRGLDIHPHWDWSSLHLVVRLSFDGKYNAPGDIERNVLNQLLIIEHTAGLDMPPVAGTGPERLQIILYQLLRFVFVTGVSLFSRVSPFSGRNNLKDISLDPRYAMLCGYREEDLDRVFGPDLAGLDREAIRSWYNGYHWRGGERGLQPLRRAAGQPRVPAMLVRDRVAGLPVPAADGEVGEPAGTGGAAGGPSAGLEVRRERHRHRGAAVPDRLPDHRG